MATTGVVNGTLIKIQLTGSSIAYLTSNDENFQNDLRETTNKDSGGNAEFAYGKFSGTYNAELFMVEGATNGFSALFNAQIARTVLTAVVTSSVSGDKKYTSSVLVQNVKRSNPLEANSTVSATLQISGAVVEATI